MVRPSHISNSPVYRPRANGVFELVIRIDRVYCMYHVIRGWPALGAYVVSLNIKIRHLKYTTINTVELFRPESNF